MSDLLLIQGATGPWEVVIGLEVHAQVISKAKLFSRASTTFGAEPNNQVSFVDAGMPGMLPVINAFCVDQAIRTGLGFHGVVNKYSAFDRKNYFYPDLPNGYQISQLYYPIISDGYMDIDAENNEIKRIRIERLHLEQDAGKSIHDLDPSKTFIDLNRAGVALMEIVSHPDMRSSAQAQSYVKKLRTLLRYLNTCDGNMEQGSMRVDANISLRRPGDPLGTRTEIKNVNSIRFLGQALDYEIQRHRMVLESGDSIVQETRLYDPSTGQTRSMRSKEDAMDYRYFPDPDLPPLRLSDERIEAIKNAMIELPDEKATRFVNELGLSAYDASILTAERETADFYEEILKAPSSSKEVKGFAKLAANWLIGEVFAAIKRDNKELHTMPIGAHHIAELVSLIQEDVISSKIAKDVFLHMWEKGSMPTSIVKELGLEQVSDTSAIEAVIDDIVTNNQKLLDDYRSGKDKVFGFFVGQVMKEMKGKANPNVVNALLKKKLNEH
jgi:aspartyl-tRNA(Asn)/glutamyl-tRNA(Gln) amidotransferase subunit B